jgi:hypothetical protein
MLEYGFVWKCNRLDFVIELDFGCEFVYWFDVNLDIESMNVATVRLKTSSLKQFEVLNL